MPDKGTVSTVLPLLASVRLPFCVPATVGVKATATFRLWPALRVRGVVRPVLNSEPLIVSCVTVSGPVPLLVTFTVCELVVFNARLPNARVVGVAARLPVPGGGWFGVGEGVGLGDEFAEGVPPLDAVSCPFPPHPAKTSMERIRIRRGLRCLLAVVCLANGCSCFR